MAMEESTLRWPTDKERVEKEEVCSIGEVQNTHIKQTEGHAEANTDKHRIKWCVLKLQRSHTAHT